MTRMQREHVNPMTCGEAVMKLLAAYEVDTVFGMAGTMTLELYRGIARTGIRHVQCRNEQGASFMADGYARATGKPGVCTIIGGPGVTNAATGIAQAYCDSQPVLVLSGASPAPTQGDRKSTRLNSSHEWISYAVFCLKKKTRDNKHQGVR